MVAMGRCFVLLASVGLPVSAVALGLLAPLRKCLARLRAAILISTTALRLPQSSVDRILSLRTESLSATITTALRQSGEDEEAQGVDERVLAIDVGATRTKFLLCALPIRRQAPIHIRHLPPAPTARLWQNTELDTEDKFDPEGAPRRVEEYLLTCGVPIRRLDRLVFAVPGTVDLTTESSDRSDYTIVKNTPSMSPRFRGFDFKLAFREVSPHAKVSALPDGLAAALGVACEHRHLRSALILILGTAPAVATLFRDPSGKGRFVEVAIWQSWVWFTKIKLDDPYGYCGGLRVTPAGLKAKPKDAFKIPHHQARIRFALDVLTWERLQGRCPDLPPETQPSLTHDEVCQVWAGRLQRAVDALAERFHSVYGPPEEIHILGGNASAAYGRVSSAKYIVPETRNPIPQTSMHVPNRGLSSAESEEEIWQRVPVTICERDATQQQVALKGLLYATYFKLKHVSAPGQDPLARGWTRGGEIYMWVPKGGRREDELPRDILNDDQILARAARDSIQ